MINYKISYKVLNTMLLYKYHISHENILYKTFTKETHDSPLKIERMSIQGPGKLYLFLGGISWRHILIQTCLYQPILARINHYYPVLTLISPY